MKKKSTKKTAPTPHNEYWRNLYFAHALQGILAAGYTNLPVGNVIAMARLYADEGEKELRRSKTARL